MSTEPSRAVFLSYASQDAEAARRVCEALRASDVEVWFDQSELRGGDAWDRKIRRQIADCALFVPIISANTQARLEGYFRLEWKLAEDRSHLMAKGKPFLVPVVIDGTSERDAHVPDAFLAVQWTRLRGGEANAAFCAQVQRLLGGSGMEPGRPMGSVALAKEARPGERGEGAASPAMPSATPKEGRAQQFGPVAITAVIAVLVASGWVWRATSSNSEKFPSPIAPNSSPAAALAADEKSLVVLPLENLSPDPENAFFTDGTHVEIISTLARIADLTVLSRDAAIEFKAGAEPLAEKAKKLNVANIITGSVRRAGNDVRITLELRRARDQALLWTQSYNKQLGEGVLAIQADIADQVARVLQARERKGSFAGAQHMTKNVRAYDLFLKAHHQYLKSRGRESIQQVVAWLDEALTLDPEFVSAARLIVSALRYPHRDQRKTPEEREKIMGDAKRWAETAVRLAPGGAGDEALAAYFLMFENDPVRALPYAQNAVRALPNDSIVHGRLGTIYYNLDRRHESEEPLRRAVALDPFNPVHREGLLHILVVLRRTNEFEEADAEYRRVCGTRALPEGDRDDRYRLYGKLPDSLKGLALGRERLWLLRNRKWAEALAEIEGQLANNKRMFDDERHRRLIQRCDALRRLHREPEARQAAEESKIWLGKANSAPERDPSLRDLRQAMTLARLGEADAAIAAMRRFSEARSVDVTPLERTNREVQLAEFYAYLNRPRECCELLAKLLRVPSGITVPMLKVDPTWDNVRDDPAFKALLADPKNSAPL